MKNQVQEVNNLIKEEKLVIFCGSGISYNSGLPLAGGLRRAILEKLPIEEKEISEIIESNLPFEVFMEVLAHNSDISEILDIFKDGEPNTNHILIARLAKKGYFKIIFTTNFDMLLEKALEKEGLRRHEDFQVYYNEVQFLKIDFIFKDDKMIRIIKIHGSIEDEESIRMSLSVVASKILSADRERLITYLFSAGKHNKVLILGYSCSDEFDITPQLRSIRTDHKEVIFVEHSEIEKERNIKITDTRNPFYDFPGEKILCNTDEFMKELWNSFELDIGEYNFIKQKGNWRTHVNMWAEGLEDQYFIQGLIFQWISNLDKAIDCYDKSLVSAKRIKDLNRENAALNNIGTIYQMKGDLISALEYFEKALEVSNKTKRRDMKATQLSNIGLIYQMQGYLDKAIKSYIEALEIVDNEKDYATILGNVGTVFQMKGDLKSALQFHEEAFEASKRSGSKEVEAAQLGSIGLIYKTKSDLDVALKYFEESIKINRQLGRYEAITIDLGNIGLIYQMNGDLDKAYKYYEEALEIIKVKGSEKNKAAILGNIGVIFQMKNDMKSALQFHKEALEVSRIIPSKMDESRQLGNIGIIYMIEGNLDKAQQYFEEALDIDKKISYKEGITDCVANIGRVYQKRGNLEHALKYYRDAFKFYKEIGNKKREMQVIEDIKTINKMKELKEKKERLISLISTQGIICLEKGEKEKALDNFYKALQLALEIGDKREIEINEKLIKRLKND